MTGSIPWSEVQQDCAVAIRVAMCNQRPNRPMCQSQRCQAQRNCTCLIGDDALWALIQRCWLNDPSKRPTVAQLCDALAENPRLEPCVDHPKTKPVSSRSWWSRKVCSVLTRIRIIVKTWHRLVHFFFLVRRAHVQLEI